MSENINKIYTGEQISFFLTEDTQKELKQWYDHILDVPADYVVFTENSYMLALICEGITGKEMKYYEDCYGRQFITETALSLKAKELGEYCKKHHYLPYILICDDIIRTTCTRVNHILEKFENALFRILSDEYKLEDIQHICEKSISIYSYMRSDIGILLCGRYQCSISYAKREKDNIYNELLYNISLLRLSINNYNNCHIYTKYLSDSQMLDIKARLLNDDFIYTSYWRKRSTQYSKFIYIESENAVLAILSLRIVKNLEGYEIIPFIFLPNMDDQETNRLIDGISKIIPSKYRHLLYEWKNIKGMCALNDLINLIFSSIVLSEFTRKYSIEVNQEDRQFKLIKLVRNYHWCSFEETFNMLDDLIAYSEKATISDIVDILRDCKIGRNIMELPRNTDDSIDKLSIQNRLEDYFYNCMIPNEKLLYEVCMNPYTSESMRSRRYGRTCSFTLSELNQGYSKIQSQYCMAYFFHMIDVGYASISSYPPSGIRVVGYSQFGSVEYLSVLIKILRYYLYFPTVIYIWEKTELFKKLDGTYNAGYNPYDLLKEFGQKIGLHKSIINELSKLVYELEKIYQSPSNWNKDYGLSVSYDGNISIFFKEQHQLLKECTNYLIDKGVIGLF